MHAPTSVHMTAAKRILRYLLSTKSHGIVLCASTSVDLRVYIDSDWVGCPISRRSTSGHSAKYLAYNPVMHSRTKHINIDYHFVPEKVVVGALCVVHIRGFLH
ncbi:hypothetical protein LIER_01295 [Lithospermum erythrorhizon]|uniref:Uncharacterized protein n=1 Tax=Lithospermum erythrorhizon TaxID=34254 RepID=A0AAV3NKD9_LITER